MRLCSSLLKTLQWLPSHSTRKYPKSPRRPMFLLWSGPRPSLQCCLMTPIFSIRISLSVSHLEPWSSAWKVLSLPSFLLSATMSCFLNFKMHTNNLKILLKCNQVIPEARRYDGSGPSRIKHKWDQKEPSISVVWASLLQFIPMATQWCERSLRTSWGRRKTSERGSQMGWLEEVQAWFTNQYVHTSQIWAVTALQTHSDVIRGYFPNGQCFWVLHLVIHSM